MYESYYKSYYESSTAKSMGIILLGKSKWASLARFIFHREIHGFVRVEPLRQNHIGELRGNVSAKSSWRRHGGVKTCQNNVKNTQ